MSRKPKFQDLTFLANLLALRSALLEGENISTVIELSDELKEEGQPFEELKERARIAYLGKFANTPELIVNSNHRNHVSYLQLTEQIDDIARSFELTVSRLERFSSKYENYDDVEEDFEPKDLRLLRAEVDRFARDFIPLLSDFERIASRADLDTANVLRTELLESSPHLQL